jgi:hypothetical protein
MVGSTDLSLTQSESPGVFMHSKMQFKQQKIVIFSKFTSFRF